MKWKMSIRLGDSRFGLLGSVPTLDYKIIPTSKLPTSKQELSSFIACKEEEKYGKSKTKTSMFKVAMSTVIEFIFAIYCQARIPMKSEKRLIV